MAYKKHFGYLAACLVAVAAMASGEPCRAQDTQDIRVDALNIPMAISGSSGVVELEAMLESGPNFAPASLSARGRDVFKTYLGSGPNKAVAGDSRFGWATGRRSIDEARNEALGYCVSGTSARCRIVNVNNRQTE